MNYSFKFKCKCIAGGTYLFLWICFPFPLQFCFGRLERSVRGSTDPPLENGPDRKVQRIKVGASCWPYIFTYEKQDVPLNPGLSCFGSCDGAESCWRLHDDP